MPENTPAFLILNRELPEFAPDAPCWAHLVPRGDFPGVLVLDESGRQTPVLQRCDEAALQSILNAFRPKLLVDFEHRSATGNDTVAAAWIVNVEIRPDGLWGRLELSDLGEQAIKNKRYRHLSPAFHVAEVSASPHIVRPVRLDSAGLTNKHNLKALKPLTNSAAASGATQKEPAMKQIALALALPETADQPAVLNAITALKTVQPSLEKAEARVRELEAQILNGEAEAFVAAHAAKIKDPAAVKKQYVANKEATVALFATLADAPPPRTHNRAAAATPGAPAAPGTDQAAFVLQVRNREKCDHKTAFNIARREKPELFKEEAKED